MFGKVASGHVLWDALVSTTERSAESWSLILAVRNSSVLLRSVFSRSVVYRAAVRHWFDGERLFCYDIESEFWSLILAVLRGAIQYSELPRGRVGCRAPDWKIWRWTFSLSLSAVLSGWVNCPELKSRAVSSGKWKHLSLAIQVLFD